MVIVVVDVYFNIDDVACINREDVMQAVKDGSFEIADRIKVDKRR